MTEQLLEILLPLFVVIGIAFCLVVLMVAATLIRLMFVWGWQ